MIESAVYQHHAGEEKEFTAAASEIWKYDNDFAIEISSNGYQWPSYKTAGDRRGKK